MEDSRSRLKMILEAIVSKDIVAPSDVVIATRLPRYYVLAVIQCLEALGVVEQVYSKGSHKLYTATPLASRLLEALKQGSETPLLSLIGGLETPTRSSSDVVAEA